MWRRTATERSELIREPGSDAEYPEKSKEAVMLTSAKKEIERMVRMQKERRQRSRPTDREVMNLWPTSATRSTQRDCDSEFRPENRR